MTLYNLFVKYKQIIFFCNGFPIICQDNPLSKKQRAGLSAEIVNISRRCKREHNKLWPTQCVLALLNADTVAAVSNERIKDWKLWKCTKDKKETFTH